MFSFFFFPSLFLFFLSLPYFFLRSLTPSPFSRSLRILTISFYFSFPLSVLSVRLSLSLSSSLPRSLSLSLSVPPFSVVSMNAITLTLCLRSQTPRLFRKPMAQRRDRRGRRLINTPSLRVPPRGFAILDER